MVADPVEYAQDPDSKKKKKLIHIGPSRKYRIRNPAFNTLFSLCQEELYLWLKIEIYQDLNQKRIHAAVLRTDNIKFVELVDLAVEERYLDT